MLKTGRVSHRALIWLAAGWLVVAGAMIRSQAGLAAETIHESVIAGTWYPADPDALKQKLDDFLNAAPNQPDQGRLLALICPHAGYTYSGRIAARAYKLLQGKTYDTVIIIAPSHHARFNGVSVYDRGGYRTPLGLVPIDHDLIRELETNDSQLRYVPQAHEKEHSLEIQLPFLQRTLPAFKLVPLVMGDQSRSTCKHLASALARSLRGKSALIVASSDLSHYHSAAAAKVLDQVLVDDVAKFDPDALQMALTAGKCEACGGGAIVTTLLTARQLGADKSEILRYGNSGEVTGDTSSVVGYLAAALWAASKQQPAPPASVSTSALESGSLNLSAEERTRLLTLARNTIIAKCNGQPAPDPGPLSPKMQETRGAFVTLHEHQRLRGCIGNIIGRVPLAETISRMAAAAAFADPRFDPVQAREIPDLVIEISILTPLEPVKKIEEIQVGRDGLYLRNGYRAGLLLPQVATEYHYDRRTFLEQTCRKAGLDRNAWQDPNTQIYRFQAEVFGEAH